MVEKQASSEIAQSRERFRIDALTAIYNKCENNVDLMDFEDWRDLLVEFGEQAERDTRERCAQIVKDAMADNGYSVWGEKLAERIRGKE